MSDLELLISKYLDDELTPAELDALYDRIASDPNALAVYGEMTAIRRAARRTPTLRAPHAISETRLFEQLRREGFNDQPVAATASMTRPPARRSRKRGAALGSMMLACVAAILMLVIETPETATTGRSEAMYTESTTRSNDKAPQLAAAAESTVSPVGVRAVERRSGADGSWRSVRKSNSVHDRASGDATSATTVRDNASNPLAVATADSAITLPAASIPDAPIAFGSTPAIDDDAPAILPVPGVGDTREALLSATLRYGSSFISRPTDALSEDVSIGLDFNLGDGHRIAVLGGRSAAITEQRATNTLAIVAREAVVKDGARLARNEAAPAPYDVEIGKEWWMGVGYNYTLNHGDDLEFTVGARGAVGPRSLHLGAEIPIRYNVSKRIAVEVIPSFARIMPHDPVHDEFSIDDASDGYLYEAQVDQTAFSTYGGAVGVRIVLD